MIPNQICSWPTGSRYICNPPPTDTDDDTVILVDDLETATKHLLEDGWDIPLSDNYKDMKNLDGWFSAKKKVDDVLKNYIVMADLDKFNNWVKATEVAKRLNLLDKKDRIFLFSVIVDGAPVF